MDAAKVHVYIKLQDDDRSAANVLTAPDMHILCNTGMTSNSECFVFAQTLPSHDFFSNWNRRVNTKAAHPKTALTPSCQRMQHRSNYYYHLISNFPSRLPNVEWSDLQTIISEHVSIEVYNKSALPTVHMSCGSAEAGLVADDECFCLVCGIHFVRYLPRDDEDGWCCCCCCKWCCATLPALPLFWLELLFFLFGRISRNVGFIDDFSVDACPALWLWDVMGLDDDLSAFFP